MWLVSTVLLEIVWVHELLPTPYDATDVPESRADQGTDGGQKKQHVIEFAQFLEKFVDYERSARRPVSRLTVVETH